MDRVRALAGRGEVAVVGLGRSGSAATRLLRAAELAVYASDSGRDPSVTATAAALEALGAAVDVGGHDLERIGRATLVVLSPGVPPDAPPVARAREAGMPVVAEAELGLVALGGRVPYIAVTGTNGKTTTTDLIGHLLATAGRRARTAGNIGTPVSEVALARERPDIMALELSSFQLHDMPTLQPTVGVLTNLAPDHLDRYAGIEEYYGDKMRLFANAGPGSLWVLNADDAETRARVTAPGRRRHFSVQASSDGWFDRDGRALMLGAVPVVPRDEFPLLGDHNVANALAAALAVHGVGVAVPAIEAGLRSARPMKHRMEPVAEVDGVLWINDSKATNLSSTEMAVRAMTRPFVLLMGGRHKGEPYSRLADLLGTCRAVVAFGEAQQRIRKDLDGAVEVALAQNLDQAMAEAGRRTGPGDAVLLSPACSSYDQFRNYEERGNRFRTVVEARQ